MVIDSITDGIVIDHITSGMSMTLYNYLHLDKLTCSVAIIKNAPSSKAGKKDIIKIDRPIDIDIDVLGYLDPGVSVNIIENGEIVKKFKPDLPERLVDVIKCRNPRCISQDEQELVHIFKLTDRENHVYRCIYCESKGKAHFKR
ncbi:MAG: aspartate carbamoyltransferase regulatory subunit [Clostridia bacterium]|nr:aspartate carbamoyltransferase regulatory subunit [Clostridia bacterium]